MEPLELGCGRCMGCRLHRAAMWSLRCQHEASLYDANSFVTLTYDDQHMPPYGSLRYADVQRFLRRLRKLIQPQRVRFFCAGEYGHKTLRPHYHMLLFGVSFGRGRDWSRPAPARLNESPDLTELWPHGLHHVGDVTPSSCGYCARYALKKVYGRVEGESFYAAGVDGETGEVYERVPEFLRMSLKPGIGAAWYQKFGADLYPRDVAIGPEGRRSRVPRYYEKLFAGESPLVHEQVLYEREIRMMDRAAVEARSVERRAAREEILRARVERLDQSRSL